MRSNFGLLRCLLRVHGAGESRFFSISWSELERGLGLGCVSLALGLLAVMATQDMNHKVAATSGKT